MKSGKWSFTLSWISLQTDAQWREAEAKGIIADSRKAEIYQRTPNKGESVELPWQTVCVSLPAGPDPKACSLRARYTDK